MCLTRFDEHRKPEIAYAEAEPVSANESGAVVTENPLANGSANASTSGLNPRDQPVESSVSQTHGTSARLINPHTFIDEYDDFPDEEDLDPAILEAMSRPTHTAATRAKPPSDDDEDWEIWEQMEQDSRNPSNSLKNDTKSVAPSRLTLSLPYRKTEPEQPPSSPGCEELEDVYVKGTRSRFFAKPCSSSKTNGHDQTNLPAVTKQKQTQSLAMDEQQEADGPKEFYYAQEAEDDDYHPGGDTAAKKRRKHKQDTASPAPQRTTRSQKAPSKASSSHKVNDSSPPRIIHHNLIDGAAHDEDEDLGDSQKENYPVAHTPKPLTAPQRLRSQKRTESERSGSMGKPVQSQYSEEIIEISD